MKNRLLFAPVLLALVVSLAACGGGSQHIPAGAIAVVNGTPVTLAQYNDFFAQAVTGAQLQGQTITPGTAEYTALRNQTVSELVQLAEVQQQMKKEGVTVTPSDIDKFIADLVKTTYHGSQAKFQAALKKSKLSLKSAREQVYINRLATKMHDKVTASAKVTTAEEKAYYNANPSTHTAQPTLEIAASRKLANKIEKELKNGASFATLAKKYSQDPGSAAQGGKYTATEGKEVPAYDRAAFALKTGQLSGLVDATAAADGGYGFFIIKPLAPVKKTGSQKTRSVEHILVSVKTKAKTSTFKKVQATIQQTLLQQAQSTLWTQWLSDLQNEYKGKVDYQSGYAPPTTTALPSSVTTPTTTG